MTNFQFQGYWDKNVEFLLTKQIFETLGLLVKNLHFWLCNPEIENLPLIHLRIYKKIFFSGSNSKIFTKQVEIAIVQLLGKVPFRDLGMTCPSDCGGFGFLTPPKKFDFSEMFL